FIGVLSDALCGLFRHGCEYRKGTSAQPACERTFALRGCHGIVYPLRRAVYRVRHGWEFLRGIERILRVLSGVPLMHLTRGWFACFTQKFSKYLKNSIMFLKANKVTVFQLYKLKISLISDILTNGKE
ncbi:MAG: hypothetical protein J6W00_12120, partial [Lentisphaeria bacterium]|nr:hypothetical protein [Lentisphaeria bacterium]